MSDSDDELFDDLDGAYATINMMDDDGNELEFIVISSVSDNGTDYLLVVESSQADDDEAEAAIIKQIREEGEESVFVVVDDDEEFTRAVSFFKNSNDDYDIEV